ncbi:BICD family-like cargo adapter 1 isoform X1 [Tachysurus fulvidraco]|uniref:BICD family-like cargo adapter 1 isoform X1 n=1 Tax=Tachysurus fulvidraco TaxID=1234273 RepID=UPI001FF07399|nr:BICD family-like cargo adapter 1 isoform X1 [Tachysurus fulvidraco]
MSAFGFNLHSVSSIAAEISAPAELDSACADCDSQTPPASRGDFTHPPPFIHLHPSPIHIGPGGLGTVLEEELAMLTREREEELIINEQDADLLALFRQKEKDLVLAAKLGKALLERNQDLTKQYEKMTKDLNEKLENLEQEKHELQQRLERREGEWEGRVAELETDVQQLKGELDKHKLQMRETDRDKTHAITELSEQNYSLLEQLSRAADVERQLCTQVHLLQNDFKEKNLSKNQHMTQLESLQAEQGLEIKMLSERKQELERCLNTLHEENEQLQSTVDNLKDRTLVLEKLCQEKDLQLQQSRLELQEVRVSHRQLSARLAEMTEEKSLQGFSSNTHSLLCEIEQSMEQEELKQEKDQLRLQLWEVYCQIRSICSQLRGNDITDSALSTDSSMDESSETLSTKDVPMGSLQSSLSELRRLAQNLLDGNESTGSRRSDEDVLEEHMRKLGEELREIQDLYEQEQERVRSTQEDMLQLHNQIALLSLEVCSSREENEKLKASGIREPSEQLQNAIRDRDDAITKKKAVEMELAKCKVDIMSLNSQLVDAIQQKFNLSQQLEAWQFASSGLFTVWLLWFLI